MIPKNIYYIWLGGESNQPDEVKRSIDSWYKVFKDYTINKIDENNIDDYLSPLLIELLKLNKYAYASDIIRLEVLIKNSGIYLDTDEEFVKPFTDDMLNSRGFVGCETRNVVAAGVIGVENKNDEVLRNILSYYEYIDIDKIPSNPKIFTEEFCKLGFKGVVSSVYNANGWKIYPKEYFYPIGYNGSIKITDKSIAFHYWLGSAIEDKVKWKKDIDKIFKNNSEVIKKFRGY